MNARIFDADPRPDADVIEDDRYLVDEDLYPIRDSLRMIASIWYYAVAWGALDIPDWIGRTITRLSSHHHAYTHSPWPSHRRKRHRRALEPLGHGIAL